MKHKATKQILSILLAMIMLVGMLPTTALAEDKINQVSLTLDVPVIGQTLDFTPTAYEGIYEITSVRWLKDWGEHGNMLCDIYHTVEPGEPYTVRIYINPKEGYSFADLDDVTVTVNGSTDGVTFTHDDLYTGIICSVAFEKLGYAVSFNANGGTGTMDEVTDVYPDYTLPACDFTAPEGKVFNGWTVGSPSGKWYAEGSKLDVNSDVTLYAKWADPTGSHKITFVNRTTDPYSTVEIIVSEGMYTLPGIEGIFQIPWGSTFDDWGINTGSGYTYYDAGAEISVTEDLEIIATWAYIEYEYISKAIFDVKLNSGAEYKHGMLAGSLSVSLGDVTGSFKEGAAQPISLASGGYGHGYWIVSGDMLLGTDALSTRKDYRLYVKFDIPDDRNVRFNSDDFSLSGDLGNITARNIVSLDGALVAIFVLPAVPGTPLTANVVTFTLDGYAIDQTIPAVTVDSSTAHVSLQGSGYGIDNAYMIYEDYVDFDTKVTNLHAKFEKHQDYCLQIDYALDEGYSFPDSFWDGSYLKKDKFKLAGFEDAVVTAVTKTSVSFRLPQLGTTAVESLEITLNGYEAGKTAWDVSLTAPECMNLPELDNPTYPPYGRLYCYYNPVYGFGDSADGDCSPIDSGTVLKVGDQYPFAIKFYPVDGYNYSELEKENALDMEKVDRILEKEYKGITIELKEVNIHYKDGENVIHRGDFIANAGEITAVVGPSGEGKTTLIRVLLGLLHPMEGRAELKNAEGIKCRLSAGTREFFSYVPQGNTIFAGSIAENMRMVKEDATDEEIREVLEMACAYDFVKKLPKGMETVVGEKGSGLSEGQAQRLAIARALLKNAPVLILDEATSALDIDTEERVLKNIMKKEKGRTCVVTTHRPSVLSVSDHIYEIRESHLKKLK